MNRSDAPVQGAFWMVLAGAAFAGVNTLEQVATVQAGLPAPTAAFLQYLVAFLVVLPWAVRHGIREMRTRRPGLHGLRVVLWGKNLTDATYLNSLLQSSFGDSVAYADPRTFGIRGEYAF